MEGLRSRSLRVGGGDNKVKPAESSTKSEDLLASAPKLIDHSIELPPGELNGR